MLKGIPTERLSECAPRVFETIRTLVDATLADDASGPPPAGSLNMTRMRALVGRRRLQLLSQLEEDSGDTLAHILIGLHHNPTTPSSSCWRREREQYESRNKEASSMPFNHAYPREFRVLEKGVGGSESALGSAVIVVRDADGADPCEFMMSG